MKVIVNIFPLFSILLLKMKECSDHTEFILQLSMIFVEKKIKCLMKNEVDENSKTFSDF